jgi:Flp pilus assembly protein TadG
MQKWAETTSEKRTHGEKGQSLVEIALLLPLLILILAGILDLGRAFMTLVALNDAAAEGATYAALRPWDADEIVDRTTSASSALVSFDTAQVTIDYQTPATPGRSITVTVAYDYQLLTPVVSAIVPSGTLVMRAQEVRSIIGY